MFNFSTTIKSQLKNEVGFFIVQYFLEIFAMLKTNIECQNYNIENLYNKICIVVKEYSVVLVFYVQMQISHTEFVSLFFI